MSIKIRATVEDLHHVPDNGKAELVNGELVLVSPTGALPARAGLAIVVSLREHARQTGIGEAVPDNAAFIVDLPSRRSFSPDVAYYIGPDPGMSFYEGAPVLAVEVRSENDYGPKAERAIAAKRDEYFAAGTLVVWDVDLLSDVPIKVYRSTSPATPTAYRRGEVAEAEPAVPGWRFSVDDLLT